MPTKRPEMFAVRCAGILGRYTSAVRTVARPRLFLKMRACAGYAGVDG